MPGVFRDLHKLEWLYVVLYSYFCIKWLYKNLYVFWGWCVYWLVLREKQSAPILCLHVRILIIILPSLCFGCRILENNDIHQVSPMTFSGLNSLVLLWACFIFYILAFCPPAVVSLLAFIYKKAQLSQADISKLLWEFLEAVITMKVSI